MTITEFLLAQIEADEADPWRGAELVGTDRVVGAREYDALAAEEREWVARVLADCQAKRRIVEHNAKLHEYADQRRDEDAYALAAGASDRVLMFLALPYADRAGYDEAWRA